MQEMTNSIIVNDGRISGGCTTDLKLTRASGRFCSWPFIGRCEAIRRLVEIGLKCEGEMTDQPTTTSRFVLRKGAVDGKWMIWD